MQCRHDRRDKRTRGNLTPQRVFIWHDLELYVVLPAWHKTEEYDHCLVGFIVDLHEYTLPGCAVNLYREPFGKNVRDDLGPP